MFARLGTRVYNLFVFPIISVQGMKLIRKSKIKIPESDKVIREI